MNRFSGLFTQYKGLRKEIYVLFFGCIVTNLGSMIWPMLTMILSQKMGMDASGIAILMLVWTAITLPANLLGGRMADRFNKKRIIVICDAVSVIGYVLCGLIPLGPATIGLMLVSSVFQNLEGPAYNALFADLTATKDRERAFSLQYLGINLGLVLSPTIAGILFKDYLWLSFILSGVTIGFSTLLIALLVRNITPEPDDSEEAEYQKSREDQSLWRVLKENKLILLFLILSALYYTAYGQYNFLLPLEMGRVHGETGAVIFGTVSSLNCIVVVLFTPLITRLFRRMTDPKKFLTGQLLLTAGYLLFLLLLGSVPIYYGAMLLFTWGEIFVTIADGPYMSNRIPASHRGRFNSLLSVAGALIGSAGDLAVGGLYDGAGSVSAWAFVLGILAAAVCMTLVLARRDRRTYPKLYEAREREE